MLDPPCTRYYSRVVGGHGLGGVDVPGFPGLCVVGHCWYEPVSWILIGVQHPYRGCLHVSSTVD